MLLLKNVKFPDSNFVNSPKVGAYGASHPYHRHGRAGSLRQAVRSIQGHDRYQIEVREGGAGSGRKEASRAKGKAR